MRRWILGLVVSSVAFLLAASAQAGPLTAGVIEFSLGGATPLTFTADGTLAGSAVDAENVTMQAGGAFAGNATASLPAPPLSAISVNIGDNTGGGWAGNPLTGSSVTFTGTANLLGLGGVVILAIPLNAGASGTQMLSGGGVTLTLTSYPWTSGTITITGLGPAPGSTVTAMGAVTTGTPGLVSLVSAAKATSNLADPTYTTITLNLTADVPEPVAPGLLLAGAAIFGVVAWRKRQA